MMKTQTKSLKSEIKQQISSRIIISLVILFLIIVSISLFEFQGALKNIRRDVTTDVSEIEDFIISQVLVNNQAAVDLKLSEYKRNYPDRSILWKPGSVITELAEELIFSFPFSWTYHHPIRRLSTEDHGAITVKGSLWEFENLVSEFFIRVVLLFLFLGTISILLLPLGGRIPKRLILDPLNQVLESLRSTSHSRPHIKIASRYDEINSINKKVESFLSERELVAERQRELDKKFIAVETTQTLAHEVRRPFVKLKRTLDALENIQDKNEFREFLTAAIPDINHSLASVSRKLTDLTNLGNPKPLQRTDIDLHELIMSALREATGLHSEKHVEIDCDIQPALMGKIDFERMHRVFSNIVENALKLTNQNGEIWINATTDDYGITQVCIGNSGSFVPESDRVNIFKLFYSTDKNQGSGIGLAVAKMHVEEHGGKIWCESDPEVGTEIFVTIPHTFRKCDETGAETHRSETIAEVQQVSRSSVLG